MSVSSPGFRVVTAPRLEPLFARLAATLRDDPLDPTLRETILVAQNVGLRSWLGRELAQALGVAASLDLSSPRELVTGLARRLDRETAPPEDEAHPFEAAGLAWRIRAILDDLPDVAVWAPVRAYLDRTANQTMPLATRLAALFDDYQVYRPDALAGWVGGTPPPADFPHGAWQAALWRQLVAESPGTRDRATEMRALLAALRDAPDVLREHFPTRIAVFGAGLFPPVHLRALHALAPHVPVTLYAVAPGDATGPTHDHPLLRALAGRSRDYWSVLDGLGGVEREDVASEAPPPTSLGGLQAALASDTRPSAPAPVDATIRIHDCHSATRELEALRDTLLDAFAEVEGLRPSDVLVLIPDLATYAPLVDAVFGAEDAAPQLRIPYHVVDHPHAPALRVVEAFGRALRLHDGRVTASELLDLLGTPAIRRAAGIDEPELPRLRAWATTAGVCWGLTAERKGRFDVPEDDLHTWRFGLDRLLLGVMTGDAGGDLVLGHLPCDAATVDPDLLGRFCEWAEALFASLDAIDRPAPLDAWPGRILTFLDGVFDAREDEELAAVVFLREQALALDRLHGVVGGDGPVSFRTVRAHLDGASGRFERREPYLTGRVTVAHPLALRHAPFRVVAMLGLNDGVWPRPEQPAGFDLLAHAPEPGDAAPRDHEKQLFLDAVMAARDRLILSYVGRSQKDNAERAASVCLDAVLDAARLHWGDDAETLVTRHRLQPFAAEYFTPGGPLASYARQHRVRGADAAPPAAFLDPARRLSAPDAPAPDTLTLRDLADAWVNPSRHVVRGRLRVSLDLDDDALHDDEPVVLDALERYHLRAAVLEGLLDGLDDATLATRVERSGKLPAGAPGASWLRRALDEARPVADAVRRWGPTEPLVVDVSAGEVRLVGTLDRVGERGGLLVRAGKVRGKHTVQAWVDHLALCATRPGITCSLGVDDTAVHFAPVGADDARRLLASLVQGYRRNDRESLPLYEKASEAYVGALSRSSWEDFTARILNRGAAQKPFEPHDGAMRKARRQFSDAWNDFTDDADAYVALATRGREDPFEPEAHFAKWALCLWAPLLTYKRAGVPE
ncbi:exodeoxyribonuclease V subunit gamma [Rubrivirga sp. IMCC43871]|uniref:exodeoxyribonuclease V subunit gamma n=1 Tax=Rubrivirga sp. IMCC43871 TaxID=3391575 RepID=UPI00398FBFF5